MLTFLKPVFLFFPCLLVFTMSFAQDTSAVNDWKFTAQKTGEGKFELSVTASISNGWQVYAPNQALMGVNTTELRFTDSSVRHSGNFITAGSPIRVESYVFRDTVSVYEKSLSWKTSIEIEGTIPSRLQGTLFYSFGRNDEYYPFTEHSFFVNLEGGVESSFRPKIETIDIKHPMNDCGDDDTAGKSLFGIFLLGVAGGFIALLTPCVFPMIPLTVSFFTKKGQSRRQGAANATLYGFFIFLIYVLLSLPFHIFNASPQVLNNLSTNVWLNLFFFAIFIVFAISFFGYFEIALPGGVANKINARSGIGSIGGIFFMAFTLAIVSFSCTGPILGSLLVGTISESGGPLELSAGMAGFGLALALPFAVFAVFPNWLQSLPKSGGWLNSVKVVLGFLEVAMAIKFLSNADLVQQWGLLKREVFIGLWLIIGLAILLYLFGKIKFPHDSRIKKFSGTRIAFILLFLIGTAYLVPGITNTKWANLKLISGFPPPLCYSIYDEPVNCKRGFEPLRDYEEALKRARLENKPILIDFTGWACVNCRRMEEAVWTNPEVDSLMRNRFVVVSLYVDERTKLPLKDQIVFTSKTGEEKSIITVGDKWSNFQIENFNATSQPQYAIISTKETALTKTKGYTPDPDEFISWLQCGLDAFEISKFNNSVNKMKNKNR